MRYILFLLFFSISTHSVAQVELLGEFVTGFRGMGYECFNFVGKDSFYFDAVYCAEIVRGKGRCEIRGNMLYLYYEKASEKDSTKLPEITISDNKDGIAELNIQCVNLHSDPIAFGTVQIRKSNGKSITVFCDSAGRAYYRINIAELPIELETQLLGATTQKLRIDSLGDYNVRIFLENDLYIETLNKGEVRSYEIDEVSEDEIMMKPAKTTGEYRRYTKKYF